MTRAISNWDFALFSANLHKYLPTIAWNEHPGIYSLWKDHHTGQTNLGRCPSLSDVERLRRLPPGILLLFHLGHHLQLPLRLAHMGLSFDIVLDHQVYLRSRQIFERLQREMNEQGREYHYLFSDDTSLLLRVRERLRSGRHLLIFGDGTSGAAVAAKDRRVSVPFLQGEVLLKIGIPFMAHLFGVALYPLICEETTRGLRYVLQEAIVSHKDETRDAFIYRALCQCYAMLGTVLRRQPWLWECWPCLHSNGMLQVPEADMIAIRKNDPMLLLSLEEKYYLFDRRYYYAQPLIF